MSLRRRTARFAAAAVAGTSLLVLAPATASAHSPPPGGTSWHRCYGTAIFGGDSWQTVGGIVYAPRNTATQYMVRIRPAWPFGWSGYAVLNRISSHPPIWIPVGTTHWFHSPAIITSPTNGTYGVVVSVRPNIGVFNNYGVEVWSPYYCRYWPA
jgi:hypothetical protein